MAIQSLGVGSGMDIGGLVSQLVAAEGAGPLARLDRQEMLIQARLSAIGKLKSALSNFQGALSKSSDIDNFRAMSMSIADSTIFNGSVTNNAAVGNYSVNVTNLAQNHKLASQGFVGNDSLVSTGTLSIEFGTDNAGVFTANATKPAQTITIDGTNNTLTGVRDAINNAGAGVTASIIYNGTDYQLALSSNDTGADSSLRLSGIAELSYDPANIPGSTMSSVQTAQDAALTIDGINITSATNTISDAIEGVSLDLVKVGDSTFSVSKNTQAAMDAVKGFVAGYNAFMTAVNEVSSYNEEAKAGNILIGDASVRTIVGQIQRIISTPVEGLNGKYRFTGDIGLATQKDGTLKIDETKLKAAIDDNALDVGRIFSEGAGTSDALMNFVSSTSDTEVGVYGININSITPPQVATSGVYSGNWTASLDPAAFPGFTIAANDDQFSINVDGVLSNAILLTQQAYNSGTELATEIQTKINADASLIAAAVSVTVTYEGDGPGIQGRFIFTSNSTGAASDISFASEDPQTANRLGFASTVLNNIPGLDAQAEIIDATIGGYATTQEGNFLIGAVGTPVEGLKIEYLGGGIGARGTVDFTRGMASTLTNMFTGLLDSKGVFSERSTILNDSLDDIKDQRAALARRLEGIEKRYMTKFIAMDMMVSQLQSSSNYMMQQIANLPGPRSSK